MDDLELAQRLAVGDAVAYERLVREHHAPVYRFLRHLARRPEDAEDLTQETFLRARRGAARFDGRTGLRPWLLGIAYHEFTRWARRRPWLQLLSERRAPDPGFAAVEDAEWLLGLLAKVPLPARAAILLHEVQELSVAEIAAATGVPVGTVKSRLHTARTKLRQMIEGIPEVKTDAARSEA